MNKQKITAVFSAVIFLLICRCSKTEEIETKEPAAVSGTLQKKTEIIKEQNKQDADIIFRFSAVNKNIELKLKAENNSFIKLSGFDIDGINGDGKPISVLITKPEASISGSITSIICSGIPFLTSVHLKNAPFLQSLDCSFTGINEFNAENAPQLCRLYFENCLELNSLPIETFPSMAELNISNTPISRLNTEKNANLAVLNCSNSGINEINVSENKKLEELDCSSLNLGVLNIKNNILLKKLNCSECNLKILDISSCPQLVLLKCTGNELKDLALFKNNELEILDCSKNELSNLFLDLNTKLKILNCSGNKLDSLTLSSNKLIEELYCYKNQIKMLDIEKNFQLRTVFCFDNMIYEDAMQKLLKTLPEPDDSGYDLRTIVVYAEENASLNYDSKNYYDRNYKPSSEIAAEAAAHYWNVFSTKYAMEDTAEILRTAKRME